MWKNQKGFGRPEVMLVILLTSIVIFVIVVGFAGWDVWHNHNSDVSVSVTVGPNKSPTKQVVIGAPNSEEAYTGIVTSDLCAHSANVPIGDVGCSLIIDKAYSVAIVHGNAYIPTWGKIYGFNPTQDITGKQVEIKANKNASGSYSLSKADDYVKLVE